LLLLPSKRSIPKHLSEPQSLPAEDTIGWKQIQIKQALTEVKRKQK
jgi:hypothetical protein